MSCQNVIDKNLSKDGKYLRTITVVGESGPANIPDFCCVTFMDCTVSSLTVGANSTAVLCKTKLTGAVSTGENANVTFDRCTITGPPTISKSKSTWNLCTFTGITVTIDESTAEFLSCNRTGGSEAIVATNGSTVKCLNDFGTGYEKMLVLDSGSTAEVRKPNWVAILVAIHAKQGSRFELTGGKAQGTDESTFKLEDGAVGYVANLTDTIVGDIAAISLSQGSKLEVVNCARITGAIVGITLKEDSHITVKKFDRVLGTGSTGVRMETGSSGTFQKGNLITSEGAEGILLSESSVEVFEVNEVKSTPSVAIRCDNDSKVFVKDFTSILGIGAEGIKCGDSCTIDVTKGTTIEGQAGDGIKCGNECSVSVSQVTEIIGSKGSGITVGEECQVTLQKVDTIEGKTTDGITAGSTLVMALNTVKEITGKVDGIKAGATSTVKSTHVDRIYGETNNGITLGEESTLGCNLFGEIIGEKVDAIFAPSSQVTLRNGDLVSAPTRGNAVFVSGSGGSITCNKVTRVDAFEGTCFHISGGTFDVRDCEIVLAGGFGVNAIESSGVIATVDRVSGFEAALQAKDSMIQAHTIKLLEGGSRGGVKALGGSITLQKIGTLSGIPNAIVATTGSQVMASSIGEMTMDVLADSDSVVTIATGELEGSVVVDAASVELHSVTIGMDVTVTDGSFKLAHGEIAGMITATGSSVTVDNTSVAGPVSLTESGLLSVGSTLTTVAITDGGGVAIGGSVTSAVVTNASWLNSGSTEMLVQSDLLVRTIADEILDTTS